MKEEHTMTTLKKIAALILALALCCGALTLAAAEEGKAYRIGICNFVDHESLNQIIANINARLAEVTEETGIQFEINEQNCNTAADVMTQIISDFLSDGVDLMVGVATPVAMTMQAMTEDHPIPVLFAAVSDPLSVGLVDSLEAPGANISGTSDYLDTDAVFNLIFALNPEAQNIALLYDQGQDSSTAPIAAAKALLEADGYTLGADGFYEKDGKVLELSIAHYKSRQLPDLALLMKEQLEKIGVKATLVVQEDPDAGYVATGDYDIALYCMIADTGGDPYYCVDALYRQSGKWAKAGFPTDESEALINQLQFETDIDQRAALANQIVQMSIDDNAFGYVGLFNKVSVARPGVTGFSEDIPFDFYGLTSDTDIA